MLVSITKELSANVVGELCRELFWGQKKDDLSDYVDSITGITQDIDEENVTWNESWFHGDKHLSAIGAIKCRWHDSHLEFDICDMIDHGSLVAEVLNVVGTVFTLDYKRIDGWQWV